MALLVLVAVVGLMAFAPKPIPVRVKTKRR